MRGRPKPVEEILPEVWRVVDELRRLTEGLEQSLAAHREKESASGSDD